VSLELEQQTWKIKCKEASKKAFRDGGRKKKKKEKKKKKYHHFTDQE